MEDWWAEQCRQYLLQWSIFYLLSFTCQIILVPCPWCEQRTPSCFFFCLCTDVSNQPPLKGPLINPRWVNRRAFLLFGRCNKAPNWYQFQSRNLIWHLLLTHCNAVAVSNMLPNYITVKGIVWFPALPPRAAACDVIRNVTPERASAQDKQTFFVCVCVSRSYKNSQREDKRRGSQPRVVYFLQLGVHAELRKRV